MLLALMPLLLPLSLVLLPLPLDLLMRILGLLVTDQPDQQLLLQRLNLAPESPAQSLLLVNVPIPGNGSTGSIGASPERARNVPRVGTVRSKCRFDLHQRKTHSRHVHKLVKSYGSIVFVHASLQ